MAVAFDFPVCDGGVVMGVVMSVCGVRVVTVLVGDQEEEEEEDEDEGWERTTRRMGKTASQEEEHWNTVLDLKKIMRTSQVTYSYT